MTEVSEIVAKTASGLGPTHAHALAEAYGQCASYSPWSASKVAQSLPAVRRAEVDPLNVAWSKQPDLLGSSIALALETAIMAGQLHPGPKVDVVVTGPDSPASPVRLTSEVVRQLIDQAQHRVTLVSYAAYAVPVVMDALASAAERGVIVNLILESSENLDGGGGATAYAQYPAYQWPADQRPPKAKLHAKAVIVDNRDVLLTSANMTNAAYDKNVELGVLCRGGGVAHQVQSHFDALIARGVLLPAG